MNSPSGELYQVLFDNNPAVALLLNPQDGSVIDANPSACVFYGYSRDELIHMSLSHLSIDPHIAVENIQRVVRGEQKVFTVRHRTADGGVRDVRVNAIKVRANDTELIYANVMDVTTNLQIERALRQTEDNYGRMVDIMPSGVVVQSPDERIIFTNDRFCEMLNVHRSYVYAIDAKELIIPEDYPLVEENILRRKNGESSIFELRMLRQGGGIIHALISATPILDAHGKYQGSMSIITDITDRIRMEEELLERNQELDTFSHTVAHDLKNPLSVLVGFATMLDSDYDVMTVDQVRESLQSIGSTSAKMISIINELLLLAHMRQSEVQPVAVDMNEVLHESLTLMRFIMQQYSATVVCKDPLPFALGYAPWLEEVWTNYISNAIKYGGASSRIEIGADRLEDARILYWVKDNGNGIPPEKMDKLFVPFERLSEMQVKGHGLGLSIVKRIIDKLGGEVYVRSEIGRGSVFGFILPCA